MLIWFLRGLPFGKTPIKPSIVSLFEFYADFSFYSISTEAYFLAVVSKLLAFLLNFSVCLRSITVGLVCSCPSFMETFLLGDADC